jgi:hypothetical protein
MCIKLGAGLSLASTWGELSSYLFNPDATFCAPMYLSGRNVNYYFYTAVILTVFVVLGFKKFMNVEFGSLDVKDIILITVFIAFLFLVFFHVVSRARYWVRFKKIYYGRSVHDKYSFMVDDIYHFANMARRSLPGKHKAQFITGMDISKDPGMAKKRVLRYFLYPIQISTAGESEENDCVLIFSKKDALQYVPEGYKVIEIFDEDSLIAVKDGQ